MQTDLMALACVAATAALHASLAGASAQLFCIGSLPRVGLRDRHNSSVIRRQSALARGVVFLIPGVSPFSYLEPNLGFGSLSAEQRLGATILS